MSRRRRDGIQVVMTTEHSVSISRKGQIPAPMRDIHHSMRVGLIRLGTWNAELKVEKLTKLIIEDKLDSEDPKRVLSGLDELVRLACAVRGPLGANQKAFLPSSELSRACNKIPKLKCPETDMCLLSVFRNAPTNEHLAIAAAYEATNFKGYRAVASLILIEKFDSNVSSFVGACKWFMQQRSQSSLSDAYDAATEILEYYREQGLTLGSSGDREHPAVKIELDEVRMRLDRSQALLDESALRKKPE